MLPYPLCLIVQPLCYSIVELEKHPTTENLDWFYGLLAGFVICTTGHRRGVISNMTVDEVGTAEADGDGRRIIRVKSLRNYFFSLIKGFFLPATSMTVCNVI